MEDTKKWWQSKSVWASVVAALSGVGMLMGYNVSPEMQAEAVELIGIGAATVGSLIALWGRLVASKKITKE